MDTPETIIDQLCGTFHPVFARWVEWHPHDLHLWEHTHTLSEQALMEQDLRRIGLHFASADNIGARSEFALTAECLALIRLRYGGHPSSAKHLESEIDRLYRELTLSKKHEVKPPMDKDLPFEAPLCWRITQAVSHAGRCSSSALEGMLTLYEAIAQLFVLRDGNITAGEDLQLSRYHEAFS